MGKKKLSPLMTVGIVALAVTAAFLMFLVIAPSLGIEQLDYRWVTPLIAIGAGLGAGALGGEASVRGRVPIDVLNGQPVAVSLGGGIAVFFLVLFVLPRVLPEARLRPVRSFSLSGSVVGSEPARVALEARFDAAGLPPGQALVLVAYDDKACEHEIARGRVDHPTQGTMTLFIRRSREQVSCGRLSTVDGNDDVVWSTRAAEVEWQ